MQRTFSGTYPDGSVSADGEELALVQGEVLNGTGMARLAALSADLHFDQPPVPQQHVSPFRT